VDIRPHGVNPANNTENAFQIYAALYRALSAVAQLSLGQTNGIILEPVRTIGANSRIRG